MQPVRLEDLMDEKDIRHCYATWEVASLLTPAIEAMHNDYLKRHPEVGRRLMRKLKATKYKSRFFRAATE